MIDTDPDGICYIDTNVFITAFENPKSDYEAPLRTFFSALTRFPGRGVTSELTVAELLGVSDDALFERARTLYMALIQRGRFISLRGVTLDVLLLTADLRRTARYKLPDAIHVATALRAGCRFFVSDDSDMKKVPAPLIWVRPDETGIATVLDALRG